MINIQTYTIMLSGSACIDTYPKIYVHVVAIELLGKRWCQRVYIYIYTIVTLNQTWQLGHWKSPLPEWRLVAGRIIE